MESHTNVQSQGQRAIPPIARVSKLEPVGQALQQFL